MFDFIDEVLIELIIMGIKDIMCVFKIVMIVIGV